MGVSWRWAGSVKKTVKADEKHALYMFIILMTLAKGRYGTQIWNDVGGV